MVKSRTVTCLIPRVSTEKENHAAGIDDDVEMMEEEQ